jgi:predicted CoA-binding protein
MYEEFVQIYKNSKNIAIVGISNDPDKYSNRVGKYLQAQGYRIFPVNPKETEILGEISYPDLQSIPEKIDVVDIFRKSELVPAIAQDAVAIEAKVIWMQIGIISEEAKEIGEQAGLTVVMNRCMKKTHVLLEAEGLL